MPPRTRISHAKSRGGCTNCKKRHVKCDELGPPCANCISRESASTCTFPFRRAVPDTTALIISQPPSSSSSSSSADLLPSQVSPTFHCSPTISPSLPLPSPFSISSDSSRLLDLELLHRWTTQTYATLCSIPEDVPNMVITIPRLGLRYSFLLNGALSMAALESSITTLDPAASRRYFHAALSYYDAAHLAFRQYLPSVRKNTELQYSLYMFSALVVALEMGIPLCGKAQGLPLREEKGEKGLLRQIEQLFDVQSGMVQLAFADYEGFARSDYGPALVRANEVLKSPLVGGLAISTEAALTRVKTVIECGSEDKVVVYHAALESLRICFVEEQRDTIKGLSLAYPSMVGKEFVELFKSGDDVALFVLMHWGVMLHRIGIFAWWATSFGQSLVTELSGKSMLSNAPQAALPEWWESIAWVRNQVGLDQGHGESTLSLADLSLFPSTHVRHS